MTMKKMDYECIFLIVVILYGLAEQTQSNVDVERYNEGKRQYELLEYKSKSPQYSQCWVDAMTLMQTGCKQLTDETQSRLALAYLNCFLKLQGFEVYPCHPDTEMHECTKSLRESDRGSFTTFFTHTQSICYFMQSQIWHEETESTISRLADRSSQVASQLEASHRLQEDMLNSQSRSLHNQEQLMEGAHTLRGIINSSSDNVRVLFEDLKTSTKEQRQIIGDVFDQLLSLRTTILGEVSGFYSLFFYILSLLICYLLTSAPRTSGARLWLFVIMTVNIVMEQTVVRWFAGWRGDDEELYWLQRLCRQFFLFVGAVILGFCTYMYQDFNEINNQLLTKIARQNSDIKRQMNSHSVNPLTVQPGTPTSSAKDHSSDSDYTSDDSDASDCTFILDETSRRSDEEDNESHNSNSSVVSSADLETSKSSLMSELSFLRESTPMREFGNHITQWMSQQSHSGEGQKDSPVEHSYNLRRRTPQQLINQSKTSPALRVESPNSFYRTVRNLQQVSEKNSRLLRARIDQEASLSQNHLSNSPTLSLPSSTGSSQDHMTPAGDSSFLVSSSSSSPYNVSSRGVLARRVRESHP